MKNNYMSIAYKQAQLAYKEDEVPIGCVIVYNDKIIARAHNKKVKKNCAVYHAEMEAILKACRKLNNWNLMGCEIYITLEPCLMCTGAIILSRISTIHYACKDPKGGAIESNIKLNEVENLNHYPKIIYGEMETECQEILKEFFKEKRKKKKINDESKTSDL